MDKAKKSSCPKNDKIIPEKNSKQIIETFLNNDGEFIERPLEDIEDFVCNKDCNNCPFNKMD